MVSDDTEAMPEFYFPAVKQHDVVSKKSDKTMLPFSFEIEIGF